MKPSCPEVYRSEPEPTPDWLVPKLAMPEYSSNLRRWSYYLLLCGLTCAFAVRWFPSFAVADQRQTEQRRNVGHGLRPVGIAYEDDALVLGGVCAPSPECQATKARCLWQQVMAQPETAAM